jgi:hypothetical protein
MNIYSLVRKKPAKQFKRSSALAFTLSPCRRRVVIEEKSPVSLLEYLKSKPWFPWAVGAGLIVFIFWLLFWSTPEPGPMKATKNAKGKDQKEGLYDLKVGSWQNRVDQDLEATKKQLAEIDMRQQEIRDQLKNSSDALSDLALEMKAERESRLAASRTAQPIPEQKAMGSGITVMRFGAMKSPATALPVKAKAEAPAVRQTSYLPGGSMAHSVLLTGVDAPVGGKPFPVLLALKEAFASPNSYQVPLKGCFALGLRTRNHGIPRRGRRKARHPGKTGRQRRAKDRFCSGCRSRRGTRKSLRPAASDQCRDRFGSDHFNRHRRCSHLRFGERRTGRCY